MKLLLSISILFSALVVHGQTSEQLAPTVTALCQHIDQLGSSTNSMFKLVTVADELPKLAGYLSEEEKAAYTAATGGDIMEDITQDGKPATVLLGELLEGCPAASERYLDQIVSRGDATRSLYQLPEWKTVLAAGMEAAPGMLEQEEKTIDILLVSILENKVPVAYDTLRSLRAEDTNSELIAAIAIEVPGFMRRYQMEKYELSAVMSWLEEREANENNDLFSDFGLQEKFSVLCREIEKMESFSIENDIHPDQLAVDEETIALIDQQYGKGELSRPTLRSAGSMLLLRSIMTRCEHFKTISFRAGIDQAMESLEPTPEEKVKFQALANELCECVGKPNRDEGKACYFKTMEAYGMTEENTSFGAAADDPELQRMMEAVMTLLPVLSLSCQN